jgi:hypothetical protein
VRSKVTEAKIEKRCKTIAREDGWWGRKFASPSHRGVPDDTFLKDGRRVDIEFKKPGNTPTELQWDEINAINEHGGEAYWCDSVEVFRKLLGIGCDVCDDTRIRYSSELYL